MDKLENSSPQKEKSLDPREVFLTVTFFLNTLYFLANEDLWYLHKLRVQIRGCSQKNQHAIYMI